MWSSALPSPFPLQVVSETYEELVVWEPTEAFYNRVMATAQRPAPPSQVRAQLLLLLVVVVVWCVAVVCKGRLP